MTETLYQHLVLERARQEYEHHVDLLSVPAAMLVCARRGYPVPPWLAKASAKLHLDMLMGRLPSMRGRSGNPAAMRKQINIHLLRFELVEAFRLMPLVSEGMQERQDTEKRPSWVRSTDFLPPAAAKPAIYEAASKSLIGSRAQGSAAAIKRSHLKILKLVRSGNRLDFPYTWLYSELDSGLDAEVLSVSKI